jgi:hypothetical protein
MHDKKQRGKSFARSPTKEKQSQRFFNFPRFFVSLLEKNLLR